MKKILLTLLSAIPLVFMGCSTDDTAGKGEGTIVLNPTVDAKQTDRNVPTRATSTTDLSTYYVIVGNRTPQLYPANGILENVPVGTYDITITSHIDMPAPAFDTQVYTGTKTNVTIGMDDEVPVDIEATQANTGVVFIYDSTLSNAGIKVVPTVANAAGSLTYSGANAEAVGYFAPGEVKLTLKTDTGDILLINDQNEVTLTLEPHELWHVTLKTSNEFGSIELEVTVDDTVESKKVTYSVTDGGEISGPETIDFFVGKYATQGRYADGASIFQTPAPLSWDDELTLATQEEHVFLRGTNFSDNNLRLYWDWIEEDPETIYLDLVSQVGGNTTHYAVMKLFQMCRDERGFTRITYTTQSVPFEWDPELNAAVFELGEATFVNPDDETDIYTSELCIAAAAYNSTTNLIESYFSDAHSRVVMTKTGSGNVAQAPTNYVEKRGNVVAFSKELLNSEVPVREFTADYNPLEK